ncbi:4Fe-4S dicluster domain-containing protein [candidate division KSB1 bacterium]|nr:4Fe-4S dicluster domain-containing protein [candidate division KSB1 bacterium]
MKVERVIKYEAELDKDFSQWVVSVPGGEQIRDCIQCGTCSATCPLSIYMDYTPRKIILMAHQGFKEEVLRSFTPWLCASCYACMVNCPREIKITEIMYILKEKAIEEGMYPKRFPIPVLAREFTRMIVKKGRNPETKLIIALALRTNPLNLLKMAPLGLRLMKAGRLEIMTKSIKGKDQLKTMLQSLEATT